MDNVISVFPPHRKSKTTSTEKGGENAGKNGKNAKYYPTPSHSKTHLWRKQW